MQRQPIVLLLFQGYICFLNDGLPCLCSVPCPTKGKNTPYTACLRSLARFYKVKVSTFSKAIENNFPYESLLFSKQKKIFNIQVYSPLLLKDAKWSADFDPKLQVYLYIMSVLPTEIRITYIYRHLCLLTACLCSLLVWPKKNTKHAFKGEEVVPIIA